MTSLPLQEEGVMSHYALVPCTGYLLGRFTSKGSGDSCPVEMVPLLTLIRRSWDRLVLKHVYN